MWWPNPNYRPSDNIAEGPAGALNASSLLEARGNWLRLAPVLDVVFPDGSDTEIQSSLIEIGNHGFDGIGLLAKCDHDIRSTGSIKGRGGVYEVLMFAEMLANSHGLNVSAYPIGLLSQEAGDLFGRYRILVGSTGNLGFSVGVTARRLGFAVEVHMSREAKSWKKERLRRFGVAVVEHDDDYSVAVSSARRAASGDPFSYFVDDEHSLTLLLGYSSAAFEICQQLKQSDVAVNEQNPLYVYLPCGVGGAPGGITLGLKYFFGPHVHCIFVEPVASPCMLVQLAAGVSGPVDVYACGLSNDTIADGLAVAQASLLVAETAGPQIAGVATVSDDDMIRWVHDLWISDSMRLEPSGAAGFAALARHGRDIRKSLGGKEGTTIVWTTGGAFLPDAEWKAVFEEGRKALERCG
ncbi:putative D-serine dehydratase (plasmid) [Mesorhizobium sp. 131-3-5]|nr:putative D-serine dehydratase [Mesorhizobium sp. 131-3-5]